MNIDVIIPLYQPDKSLFTLLDYLEGQTIRPRKIILMNTEERYFRPLVEGTDFADRYRNVEIHHLSKVEFDHGGTRARGVKFSDAEIFVMMTQDAVPIDPFLFENLTASIRRRFEQEARHKETGKAEYDGPCVAVAYARQLPGNSGTLEKISREFNYPEESKTKTLADLDTLGIKTFFCSDVCAAYRRDIYEKQGGFVLHTLFNEDMIYAAGAIRAGYAVRYEADACVIHAHHFTNAQQLHRNFDLGVSQAEHPEVFLGISSEAEGKKLVRAATKSLKDQGKTGEIPHFYLQCFCKYVGYLLGKKYKKLPKRWIYRLTTNQDYWNRKD